MSEFPFVWDTVQYLPHCFHECAVKSSFCVISI